jgi:hypothetical protein
VLQLVFISQKDWYIIYKIGAAVFALISCLSFL